MQTLHGVSVDVHNPLQQAAELVEKHCHHVLFNNGIGDMSMVQSQFLRGGITNCLVKVYNKHHPDHACIVRVFGPNLEKLIDREREKQVVEHLNKFGIGKQVFLLFDNGQVEEWLAGRSLEPYEMLEPHTATAICEQVAKLHSLDMPPFLHAEQGSHAWNKIWSWLAEVKAELASGNPAAERIKIFNWPQIEAEMHRIHRLTNQYASPLVPAHNDLLSGNIVRNPAGGGVTLIDFEYAGASERGFDIANHFCECVGFDCEWEKFPTVEQQNHFLSNYLQRVKYPQSHSTLAQRTAGSTGADTTAAGEMSVLVDELRQEVAAFVLTSHLFWGIWAVMQTLYSPIDFDFYTYSFKRLSAVFAPQFRKPLEKLRE
eukprot:GDKI01016172.1.p1 GENE.GDKI01016172.1~~GDKI01016172.1.p1  ORF type:complete len:372 (+),score=125.42 GDKI01016172.1:81-1196(+)